MDFERFQCPDGFFDLLGGEAARTLLDHSCDFLAGLKGGHLHLQDAVHVISKPHLGLTRMRLSWLGGKVMNRQFTDLEVVLHQAVFTLIDFDPHHVLSRVDSSVAATAANRHRGVTVNNRGIVAHFADPVIKLF